MFRKIFVTILCFLPMCLHAQIGEHRNQWTLGGHAGCTLNKISFIPSVNQKYYQGLEGGFIARYTCEKYFKTICAIQFELNYTQLGWNEDIIDEFNQPVACLSGDGNEMYKRTINYFQVPILASLAWGKENGGVNFFLHAGPQLGYMISENTKTNFSINPKTYSDQRSNTVVAQDTMKVENKFDYGIVAGIGVELALKKIGRFQIEGRFYYGLGNIYGDSKRDYFGTSRHQTITIRAAYLFDL